MGKLRDWVIECDVHLHMWEVAIWGGLALVLALGTGSTIWFIIRPQFLTGIPAFAVFALWTYLIVEGKRRR